MPACNTSRPSPRPSGTTSCFRPKSTRAADVAPAAVAFLDRKPTKPFFLDVGFFETHREFPNPTPADDPRFTQPPMPIPDTPATRADMAAFHASARLLDHGVGAGARALERNGLADNTIVVSTTDHGIAFPLMKCNLTDSGFGVSLIVRGPGVFRGGRVCDAMVSHIDVFPTLCESLQIQPPAWLEGKLVPAGAARRTARDQRGSLRRGELSRVVRAEARRPHAALQVHPPLRRPRTRRSCRTATTARARRSGWSTNGSSSAFRASSSTTWSSTRPSITTWRRTPGREGLAEMRGRLDRWMKRTADPLLKGPVPAPAGAKVNPADGISPQEPVVDAPVQRK